jgi:hypothetical protein
MRSLFNMFTKEGACSEGGEALPMIVKGEADVVGEKSHVHRKP